MLIGTDSSPHCSVEGLRGVRRPEHSTTIRVASLTDGLALDGIAELTTEAIGAHTLGAVTRGWVASVLAAVDGVCAAFMTIIQHIHPRHILESGSHPIPHRLSVLSVPGVDDWTVGVQCKLVDGIVHNTTVLVWS